MKINKLFEKVAKEEDLLNFNNLEINKVKINSKDVEEGDVFVALKGGRYNGYDYIAEAIENGAKCIVTQEDLGLKNQVIVKDTRRAFSLLCKNLNEKACDKLKIIAITGTNGKTTTSHILASIFSQLGYKVGLVGTLGAKFDGKTIDTGFTTPDPDILHSLFADMKKSGVKYVIMEASAHAIALKKFEGIKFEGVVLTNITQDHLDFFKTMDNYANTKLSLFDKKHCKYGVVCCDDEFGRKLTLNENLNIPLISYGLDNPSECFAIQKKSSLTESEFIVNCLDDITTIKSQLVGEYNVQNILAALSVCAFEGINLEEASKAIGNIPPIEGRFNTLEIDNFHVVIDYAHSPDGLENLLKTARELTSGRLITVFGCGGNRDKLKRPIMAKIASKNSDHVILTSDNPRYENPMDIIKEIEKGVSGSYEICADRAAAINSGLFSCQKGDTLVIAGKGAEKYQEINGKKYPFNDYDVVYKHFLQRKDRVGENNDS